MTRILKQIGKTFSKNSEQEFCDFKREKSALLTL